MKTSDGALSIMSYVREFQCCCQPNYNPAPCRRCLAQVSGVQAHLLLMNYDTSKSQHRRRLTTLTADISMHVNIASVVSDTIYSVDSGSA